MPDDSSPVAERGTRIHDALETGDGESLEHTELVSMEKCLEIVDAIVKDKIPGLPEGEEPILSKEERVQSFAGTFRFSGKWDLCMLWMESKIGLVVDYKTGPRGAGDADSNLQLASLAVLAAQKYDLPDGFKLYVAISSPLKQPNYTLACYTVGEMWGVYDTLATIAKKSHEPYAEAVAGEHCRYCPARRACSERNELVGELVNAEEVTAITDPSEFSRLLNLGDQAVAAHKEHRDLAKRLMVENRIDLPDWKIQTRKGSAAIDPKRLMQRMSDEGYLTAMLGTMVKVTKKGLTQVVKTKTGLAGGGLESEVKRLLEGCSTPGKDSQSLVKK